MIHFVYLIDYIGENDPTRVYKNLAVGYELGYVSFTDSINVYAFHLDVYFQTNSAFIPDLPPHKPATFYPVFSTNRPEDSDDEDSEDDDEEDEPEEDEDVEENKNFTHWFEVHYYVTIWFWLLIIQIINIIVYRRTHQMDFHYLCICTKRMHFDHGLLHMYIPLSSMDSNPKLQELDQWHERE